MNSGNSELSNKKNAFVGWVEALGFILFIVSRFAFREEMWLLYAAVALILIGFFYRLYLDWKKGERKKVKNRLILFFSIMIISLLLTFIIYRKQFSSATYSPSGSQALSFLQGSRLHAEMYSGNS